MLEHTHSVAFVQDGWREQAICTFYDPQPEHHPMINVNTISQHVQRLGCPVQFSANPK